MEQREMNFWDLCMALGRALGHGCRAFWHLIRRMIRLSYRYWWLVLPIVVLCVVGAIYYTRYDNLTYRVNAVVLLNGPTIQQFEQAYSPLRTGQQLPQDAPIAEILRTHLATDFTTYRVVDCMNDGEADYVDFKQKSSPTDTIKVQMHDRLCLEFHIKAGNLSRLPEIEEALMAYLNSNAEMQKSYDVYLPNLENEIAFNHAQAQKLDSLTSQYYFNSHLGSKTMDANIEGVSFVGDWQVKLFLEDIYEQQAHLQRDDYRRQLAIAPVVPENHFAIDPQPINGRAKCVILFFLLGWAFACCLAELIDKRKSIFAWLRG